MADSAERRCVMSRMCRSRAGWPLNSMRPARTSTGMARPSVVTAFAFHPGKFSRCQFLKIYARVAAVVRRKQIFDDVFADQLPTRQPVQQTAGLVRIQDFAGQIFYENRVGRIFKQVAEALLALASIARGRGHDPARRCTVRPGFGACPGRFASKRRANGFG